MMAQAPSRPAPNLRLAPILDEVARYIGRHGLTEGAPGSAKGTLRIELERHVRRTVQVYWTPFMVEIEGDSVGLHLEVAEPKVHWAEAYLSPNQRNWVLFFGERSDGDIQLLYYEDKATPEEAIESFFGFSGWYVLTATDSKWSDVVYQVADDLPWLPRNRAQASPVEAAVQESLKKSTIFWMRWRHNGTEHTMPVWYLYDQKAQKIYVLSGERQQLLPGAERIRNCDVILRWKGQNAQVAELPASVRVIGGDDPSWTEVANKIAEKRLNIPGLPEETADRWRDECVILELTLRS
jgi:hypothetical protein